MQTVIVGAGITGLWLAEQLAKRGDRVTVLEKYDYIGGRILTSPKGFEIGAGRIHTSHHRVGRLIRRFGLHTHSLDPSSLWLPHGGSPVPNPFSHTLDALLDIYARLPPDLLASTTLCDLNKQLGVPIDMEQFPYRGESESLRADLAIETFRGEMGTDAGFFVVREGLSAITDGLAAAARKHGVRIHLNSPVIDIRREGERWSVISEQNGQTKRHWADRIVLALHAAALRSIPITRGLRALRHLEMLPLTRIYATYPTLDWLPGRFVTNSPIRYCIPIDTKRGLVMISYTEGRDTAYWRGLKKERLAAAMQKELRRLLPTAVIPEPTWIKAYEWTDGCTYWQPGAYDPRELSDEAMMAAPGLHCVSESFSVGHQAWIEGALEQAERLLARL